VLPVIGAGTFVGLFRILDAAGVDWPLSVAVSMLPLALCAVFVWQFANPHYIVQKAMALPITTRPLRSLWRLSCRRNSATLPFGPCRIGCSSFERKAE
jgi:hypothetical protein